MMKQLESAPPDEESPPPTEEERLPHSRWGIASCCLTLFGHSVFVLYLFTDPWGISGPIAAFLYGLYVNGAVSFIAFCFGMIGVRCPRTRTFFSNLGIILSAPFAFLFLFWTFMFALALITQLLGL